jgi:hypothetical protein
MIVVRADHDGLAPEVGVAPRQDADDVRGLRALAHEAELQPQPHTGKWPRSRCQRLVDLGGDVGDGGASRSQDRVGRGAGDEAGEEAVRLREAAQRGQRLPLAGVRDEQDGPRTVLAGVDHLVRVLRVVEGLGSPEGARGIARARIPRERDHDAIAGIEPGVVVVAQVGSRDAVPRDHDLGLHRAVRRDGERREVRA